MDTSRAPIGVFDSGVGGISVLKRLVELMPHENFVYMGDSAYNPYGSKTKQQIIDRSCTIVNELLAHSIKALVIACNTATSAASDYLRVQFPKLPIIGIEPALKVALDHPKTMPVLVLATPATLMLEKYQELEHKLGVQRNTSQVYRLGCKGLAHRIEQGNLNGDDLISDLHTLLDEYRGVVNSVVLGCTHYPFVKQHICGILGDVPCYDGAIGTARHCLSVLSARGLLNPSEDAGTIEFLSSTPGASQIAFYQSFYQLPLN